MRTGRKGDHGLYGLQKVGAKGGPKTRGVDRPPEVRKEKVRGHGAGREETEEKMKYGNPQADSVRANMEYARRITKVLFILASKGRNFARQIIKELEREEE